MAEAQKIKLGARPKSFDRNVTFPMLDGTTGLIPVTYKYRTRSEYAAMADEINAELKAEAEKKAAELMALAEKGEQVSGPTQAEITAHQNAYNVRLLQRSLDGWRLDIPFDKEAIEQLVDELPAAVSAIANDYRVALTEGRLGN